jgi:hypothetical protein
MEFHIMAIKKSSGSGIPFGNNAGRPANPGTGRLYSNGETARLELYTSAGAWENIVQEVPGVSSIGGQYLETNNSNTITIYGTNFVSGATAFAIGTNAVEVAATSTTFNSLVQLTAVFTGLTSANEPYDIKVVNPSNLFGILPDSLFVNNQVAWTTSAGSLGTFADQVAISVSAVAADDSTITYAVASGSTLPSGLTLNSSTGLLSGTLANVDSNTTYTFTLTASDGSNPAVARQFSILINAAPIWSTSSGSLGTFDKYTNISLTVAATDVSDSITYALASGSTLPSGVTLNSSTGAISGTLPNIASDTTYTFTVNATDGVNIITRSFSITSQNLIRVESLVIAGGGGGGNYGGGGGGGGMRENLLTPVTSGGAHTVSVGNGGSSAYARVGNNPGFGSRGQNSIFSDIIATGGGGGGGPNNVGAEVDGGSGGGVGYESSADGRVAGISSPITSPVQGYAGGIPSSQTTPYSSGGGGGAGGAAETGFAGSRTTAGAGGIGRVSSITGAATYYAGGGGGGIAGGSGYTPSSGNIPGSGGTGGGGNGSGGNPTGNANAGNGVDNLGGGGGGGGYSGTGSSYIPSGSGGKGVVILAYSNAIPPISNIPAGLTYTVDTSTRSGYRVYKFTSGSGTITF